MANQNEQLYIDLLRQSLSSEAALDYTDLVNSARANPQQAKEMNWGVARQARSAGLDEIDIAAVIGASPYATAFKEENIQQVSDHIQAVSTWAYQDRMETVSPSLSSAQQQYMEMSGVDSAQHAMIKELASTDPDRAKSVDKRFAQNAYNANLSPENFREALEAGPYTQSLIANKASPLKVNSYLNFHEASYRNQELGDIRQTLVNKASDIAKTAYQALLVTEKSLFAITPLPMNSFKAGIQNIAFPMAATLALSKLPGAHEAISGAIHLGGSLTSSASALIAGQALAHFNQSVNATLPHEVVAALATKLPAWSVLGSLGGQSLSGMAEAASQAVFVGSAHKIGQLFGEAGTATLTGAAILKAGKSALDNLSRKGPSIVFSEVLQQGQRLLNQAESLREAISSKFSEFSNQSKTQQENSMATNSGVPQEPAQSNQTNAQESTTNEKILNTPPPPPFTPNNASNNGTSDAPSEQVNATVPPTPPIPPKVTPADEPAPPIKPTAGDKSSEDYGYSIQQMLEQRGIQTDRLVIEFNGVQKFKMEKGMDKPLTNGLSAKDVELLKQALSDPDFKGSIKISKGGETLFQRIGGGPPIIDGRQLYKPAMKLEYSSPSQLLYDQSAKDVSSQGLKRISEIATNAFRSGASLDEVKSAMISHDDQAKASEPQSLDSILKTAQGKVTLEKASSSQAPTPVPEKSPAIAR